MMMCYSLVCVNAFCLFIQRGGSVGGQNGGREREERGENQLRRRRPQTGEPEPGEGGVEEVGEEGEGEGRRGEGVAEGEPVKDPLKWFGVLVPQSLRQSQQNFIQSE